MARGGSTGFTADHGGRPEGGARDHKALAHVAEAGYRSAYQLADRKPDPMEPQLTLRRDLMNSTWTGADLLRHLAAVTR